MIGDLNFTPRFTYHTDQFTGLLFQFSNPYGYHIILQYDHKCSYIVPCPSDCSALPHALSSVSRNNAPTIRQGYSALGRRVLPNHFNIIFSNIRVNG